MGKKISGYNTVTVTFNGRWTFHPKFSSDVETSDPTHTKRVGKVLLLK